jgi:hypothetical protein
MNPYAVLSSGAGTHEATAPSARLAAWHDAMVAHERKLRSGTTSDACNDECPHVEARTLWSEAVATFGRRAQELTFLRSRAQATQSPVSATGLPHSRPASPEYARGGRAAESHAGTGRRPSAAPAAREL